MVIYSTICFIACAAMLITYINGKIGKMQNTIAITASSLIFSILIILAGKHGFASLERFAEEQIKHLDFQLFLLDGILGFLLFAGGLSIKLHHIKDQKWEITVLALCATLFSTFFIGYALFYLCQYLSLPLDLIYCLIFGALISPTDPIAVLAIVKKLNAPKRIATQIEGESLFNDGFGLVIFVTLYSIAFSGNAPTPLSVTELFIHEALGGVIYGFVLGLVFHYLIDSTDDISMELLLTIAIPTAGYVLAQILGVSGPLAMVVAGIMIGNWTRSNSFSEQSAAMLDHFWKLVDELLNGILFLLIGLSLIQYSFHKEDWLLMLTSIPLVLLARYLSIQLSFLGFKGFRKYNPYSVAILTWGGLRGGLALAMAMAIPAGVMVIPEKQIDVREIILVMTYAVVFFSILIQGSTITPLINKAKSWQSKQDTE